MAKIYRTYWLMRRRYHVVGYVGAVVGAVLWTFYLGPGLHGTQPPVPGAPPSFLPSLATLLGAIAAPIALSRLLWNTRRWRYLE